jgi:hypothetical protein
METLSDTPAAHPEQRFTRRGEVVSGEAAEYGRFADLATRFGISRSKAYELIDEGLIRSICVKRKGALTGVRLINLASVREYLKSLDGAVDPQLTEQRRQARAVGIRKAAERLESKEVTITHGT